jgi:hypothetical protein
MYDYLELLPWLIMLIIACGIAGQEFHSYYMKKSLSKHPPKD